MTDKGRRRVPDVYDKIEAEVMDIIDRATRGYGEPDREIWSDDVAKAVTAALRMYEERVREIVREEAGKMLLIPDKSDGV